MGKMHKKFLGEGSTRRRPGRFARRLPVILVVLLAASLWAAACRAVTLPALAPTAVSPVTLTGLPTPAPTVLASQAPSPSPAAGLTATQSPTQEPVPLQVAVHPDGTLYVGDAVSFEVLPPAGGLQPDAIVSLSLDGPAQAHYAEPELLASQPFKPFGIGGRRQATFTWAWDTHSLAAGSYDLTFSVEPDGPTWTQTLALQPAPALPAAEQGAAWALARSRCCAVYYITHTEAERDLDTLLAQFDAQADDAVAKMGVQFTAPITITLMPRLVGQGGFADDTISVSYLDRDYTAGDVGRIIHHEMVHILDARLGGDLRPSLLVEGLAVYESGGHFKAEPLMPRTAALLDQFGSPSIQGLNWFIPLRRLADQFYTSQHELGYMEGSSLIEYMVQRWGWSEFSTFYRSIKPAQSGSQADAIDAALQSHFNLSLARLEQDFIAALRAEPASASWKEDVRLTVSFYDSMRRYQQILDPSAYFLNAWLPDQKEMRQRNIVADYMRRLDSPLNQVLELLLGGAGRDEPAGRFQQMQERLDAVNAVLDAVQRGDSQPLHANPLAARYASLAAQISGRGLNLQRLEIEGASASAWVRQGLDGLMELRFTQQADGTWQQMP